jgi:hypothetical protein
VILRKPVVKVEIDAFLVAILTLTAGDGLRECFLLQYNIKVKIILNIFEVFCIFQCLLIFF